MLSTPSRRLPLHPAKEPLLPPQTPGTADVARSPTRAIAFLAIASFASQGMVRSLDSLLPQIAADFGTTVGTASVVITAYAVTHGTVQFVAGPVGDA